MRSLFDRTLLLISSIIFVGSVGFFLAAHAGFSAVMIDWLVASVMRG
jgi:hypothetical protein